MPHSIVWILLCGVVVSAGGRAGAAPVVSCPGDIDGDEMVTINELITAVNSAITGCVYDPAIDPADFVAAVTNPYFPLEPGTTFHYESQSEEIAVTVTHETKTIIGVACTVVHDVVMEDGEITEDTFDWYAQDRAGNVWYFGEDTTAFENGQPDKEGSWEAGVDGAKPGIAVEGVPRIGDKYRQEFYRGVAEDRGEVLSLTESVQVAYGTFENCLKTKDYTDLAPDVVENKVFCPGVGQVLALTVEGGNDREELVSLTHE